MPIFSNIAKVALAGSLGLFQTTAAMSAAPFTPQEWAFFSGPAYQEFSAMVRQHQWKSAVVDMGLGNRDTEIEIIVLTAEIMTHEGKPAGFSSDDLGQPGCLPGKEGGLPMHDGFGACHAVCRHEHEEDDGLPQPKPKV